MPTAKLLASQVWRSTWAFLRRAGTIILAVSIVLWCLLTFPRQQAPAGASPEEASRYALEHSFAGKTGHAIQPLMEPLGFDWKISIGLFASLAAREVIVSTLAQVYAASDQDTSLRFALQCMSTLAIMRRETNSWRWPAFAFSYLLALAYSASFATHRIVESLIG